jgi:hypothetical protein
MIENYDQGVQLVILRTARYDEAAEEVEFGEISIFLAPNFVITVRQGVASELRGARQRLEQRPELLAAGSSSALWAILDQVVDDYAPVVAGLEHDIDQVEATVFSGASAPTERIYSLRREATDFYRAVRPLLAAFAVYGIGGLAVPLALLFAWLRLRTPHARTAWPRLTTTEGATNPGRPTAIAFVISWGPLELLPPRPAAFATASTALELGRSLGLGSGQRL